MKSVLIIGGSSTLGISLINKFTQANYSLIATYTKSTIEKHDNLLSFKLDLTSESSIEDFINFIQSNELRFDICVFLSGILPGNNLSEYTPEEIDQVMNINFIAFTKLYKKLEKYLNNESQLIAVSSISAQRGSYDPIYAASKGALISFVKSISQINPIKTRANAIAPGLIEDTSMFHAMQPVRQSFHIDQSPTKKLTQIEDLSSIIFDMTKPHWSNVNGEVIKVNGGSYV